MKKKNYFSILGAALFAAAVMFNVQINSQSNYATSDLTLQNIEALAESRGSESSNVCYDNYSGGVAVIYLCSSCVRMWFVTPVGDSGWCY